MRIRKKIWRITGFLVLLVVLLCWSVRVYMVNSRADWEETVYETGQLVRVEPWQVRLLDTKLLTLNEFEEIFKTEFTSGENPDDRILCMQLEIKTDPEQLDAEDFEILTQNGIRTRTWYQGNDPYLLADINSEEIQKIYQSGEGTFWLAENVPAEIWEREDTYDYVLSVFPRVILLRTSIRE